ncbi:hypothetical protein SynRS9915_00518 [Synechococcus sp. RS9915]|nr:hypothetical protein SynRS9915_00518 [Synechococcus sp. RS9915]
MLCLLLEQTTVLVIENRSLRMLTGSTNQRCRAEMDDA